MKQRDKEALRLEKAEGKILFRAIKGTKGLEKFGVPSSIAGLAAAPLGAVSAVTGAAVAAKSTASPLDGVKQIQAALEEHVPAQIAQSAARPVQVVEAVATEIKAVSAPVELAPTVAEPTFNGSNAEPKGNVTESGLPVIEPKEGSALTSTGAPIESEYMEPKQIAVKSDEMAVEKSVSDNAMPTIVDPEAHLLTEPAAVESGDLVAKYVPNRKRPRQRRGWIPKRLLPMWLPIGERLDIITESPRFIKEKEDELARRRATVDSAELGNCAFVRFTTQEEAHRFARMFKKQSWSGKGEKKALKKIKTGIEVVPEDIVWKNLSLSPSVRIGRAMLSWILTILLLIFW